MWEWLPEELQTRIVEQLIATGGAGQLPLIAKLDRRSSSIAKVHLEPLKTLHQPPFALSWRAILVSTSLVKHGGGRICDADLQALSAALSKGALPNLEKLPLYANQIGNVGISALASACANGALPALQDLRLSGNQIGDIGLSALATALGSGALASVSFIDLGNNKATEAGKKAMRDVAQTRGFLVDLA